MSGLPSTLPAALGGDASTLVLPTLSAMVIKSRAEFFQTDVQESISSREIRSSWWLAPRTNYSIAWGFLRTRASLFEFQTLAGFFARMGGRLNSFLFTDPDDSTVTAHPFSIGDGAAKTFQVQRSLYPGALQPAPAARAYWPSFGGGYRPVYEFNSVPLIYVDTGGGPVLKTGGGTDYTLGAFGAITFVTAPAAGAILTWTGTYYWRIRFDTDSLPLERMMPSLYAAQAVPFITVKP